MAGRGSRAVVIGASLGGLLAARVLQETFHEVVLVERDPLCTTANWRRGVPQGRHAHGLLARGREIFEDLFPGLTADLVRRGALTADIHARVRWYQEGRRLRQANSGMVGLCVSRPLLEDYLRRRVTALPRVRLVDAAEVVGVAPAPGTSPAGLAGVTVRGAGRAAAETIDADLVVDASGRGTRTLAWLEALGFPRPAEDEVHIGLTYTTRVYRRRPEHLDGDLCVVVGATPECPRMAGMIAQEGDRWIVTLGGYLGDRAPLDADGFLEFARSLPAPEIHDVISRAEPLTEAAQFGTPWSRRRRFESLQRVPEGYLAFGDVICAFNPVYGQGMTVAAAEALALRESLEEGVGGVARRFYARASGIVDVPWSTAVGGDLRIPGVEGRRTVGVRAINWYVSRLTRAAAADATLAQAFVRVANMVASPSSLFAPAIVGRVAAAAVRGVTGGAANAEASGAVLREGGGLRRAHPSL